MVIFHSYVSWLVVWNMNFSFSEKTWDNPSHWRTHIFQDGWNHQPECLPSLMEQQPFLVGWIPVSSRLVTRFERLSRRISLAGLLSNHQATEAIAQGTLDQWNAMEIELIEPSTLKNWNNITNRMCFRKNMYVLDGRTDRTISKTTQNQWTKQ